jgi:hypothetical protein
MNAAAGCQMTNGVSNEDGGCGGMSSAASGGLVLGCRQTGCHCTRVAQCRAILLLAAQAKPP